MLITVDAAIFIPLENKLGLIPIKITGTIKIVKNRNSRRFKSLKFFVWAIFKLPKIILLYNHKEYAPHKITPKALKIQTRLLTLKIPQNSKNSPTKLLVPGNAILAMVNTNKYEE